MKWSPDHQFLATGGNDNQLLIWSLHRNKPVQTYAQHTAAVKVLSSPPWIALALERARDDYVVYRRWRGARISTVCSCPVVARPTARCAFGIRSPARQCTASTPARKCATSSGHATHPNWYSSSIAVDGSQCMRRVLRSGVDTRLLAESDSGLVVPITDAGGEAYRPHIARALSGQSSHDGIAV